MLHLFQTWDAGFILDAFVSHTLVRTHIERPYVFLMYDCFRFWNAIPWSATFPTIFSKKEWKVAKGRKCRPVTPASVQRGGDAAPLLDLYRTRGAGFIFNANVFHTPLRAHIRTREARRKIPARPDTSFPYARAKHGGKSPLTDTAFPADGNTVHPLA